MCIGILYSTVMTAGEGRAEDMGEVKAGWICNPAVGNDDRVSKSEVGLCDYQCGCGNGPPHLFMHLDGCTSL